MNEQIADFFQLRASNPDFELSVHLLALERWKFNSTDYQYFMRTNSFLNGLHLIFPIVSFFFLYGYLFFYFCIFELKLIYLQGLLQNSLLDLLLEAVKL